MNNPAQSDWGLFEGGPPIGLQRRLGIVPPGPLHIRRRMILVIAVAWIPLAILAAAQHLAGNPVVFASFLSDLGVHARLLIAAPLFILADTACASRLSGIAHHFLDAGLVLDKDRPAYEAALASTARLRDSNAAEFVVIALAYAQVAIVIVSVPHTDLPAWLIPGPGGHSWAGLWHRFISLPLLLILLLGWMWRLILWTRLLALIARLDLHLIPAHPDRAAGLRFVGYSVRGCAILGFALGTIVAGSVANGIVHEGAALTHYRYTIGGVVLVSVILFCGPLLLFLPKLMQQWRRGIFEYGALADSFGREFERKWFSGRKIDENALETQDFSAATDLYQVVGNVYEMHLLPMDLKSIVLLVVATLLPFLPVLLLAIPLDTILSTLAGLML